MHSLTRGSAPPCLNRYQHGRDKWDTLHRNPEDVRELRDALAGMHRSQCAYCESATGDDWHVEHLWARAAHPQRTFAWQNLFASCNRQETCGTFKDQQGRPYAAADLIDPSTEDPDAFLFFAADGIVHPRLHLVGRPLKRALETIRVFNLNAPVLTLLRRQVVDMVLGDDPDVVGIIAALAEDERPHWISSFIQDYCADCFPTPVRHLLSA